MKMTKIDTQSKTWLLLRNFENLHKIWFNTSKFSPQSDTARTAMNEAWAAYQAEKEQIQPSSTPQASRFDAVNFYACIVLGVW